MPPPTSRASPQPTDEPARPNTPPSYLSALRQLESPVSPQVINLAATLTTQAENEVDADNVSFLRRPVDPQEEWRQQNAQAEDELFEEVRAARERLRARTAEMQHDERDRQTHLQRVLSRLSRMEDSLSYSDRVPARNQLYDWSPPADLVVDHEELQEILRSLPRHYRYLKRHHLEYPYTYLDNPIPLSKQRLPHDINPVRCSTALDEP
ncbi:putative vacuolar import degradation protein vid24 [Diplodia seriata]|uniref:Putative vacuolar import degradation protein vid24 n=1 Tax=Diplodia seriata TaxID=420778 RepID=A0A0G2F1L6_9PEZI|nr:putative vacuolar import degradation protein vid24 [Diplodia seriata]